MSSWKTYIIVACNGLAAARSQHNHQDVLLTFLAATSAMFTEVVLPHLPPEASPAQEQVHLAVGHLQTLHAQLDGAPAFERDELEDAKAIGLALAEAVPGTEASALRGC